MMALATAQRSAKSPGKSRGATTNPLRVQGVAAPLLITSPFTTLQRKPMCPCGGSCPRCQESLPVQAKLTVSQPHEQYEQEADHMAEQVMRMPELQAQRQAESEEEEEETVQTKAGADRISSAVQGQVEEEEEPIQAKNAGKRSRRVAPALQTQLNALRGSGRPFPRAEREFFESRFGYDFSTVRVYTDSRAHAAARAINARAFTHGQDIVFALGQYAPRTAAGKKLLAHELTHVVQQGEGKRRGAEATPAVQRWDEHEEQRGIQEQPGLSADETVQVREWVRTWRVNRGLGLEPLTGDRAANEIALAEGIVSRRLRARGEVGIIFEPETDPEVRALAIGPIRRIYGEIIPSSFDALTPHEQVQLNRWMMAGHIGLADTLSGERAQELDALIRAIFCNRLSLTNRPTEDPLLCIEEEVTRSDPRFRALLSGPVTRHYDAWNAALQSALSRVWVRGNQGEAREVAVRRLSRLYARYCIPDWADWYATHIDTSAEFLGSRVIGGLHRQAATALRDAEARLRARGGAPRLRRSGGGGLGGYNARGWGENLGAHDFGMAFDLDPTYNIEVRGPRGVAWAGTPAGEDRIAVVKLFTGFDVLAFAYLPAWERDVETAASASDEVRRAIPAEIATVEALDEAGWRRHREALLARARARDAFPQLLRAAEGHPERLSREAWLRFMRNLLGSTRRLGIGTAGFFNIPPDVVMALTDPLRRSGTRFHWVPFHHFELVNWRSVLESEGVCFPRPSRRRR